MIRPLPSHPSIPQLASHLRDLMDYVASQHGLNLAGTASGGGSGASLSFAQMRVPGSVPTWLQRVIVTGRQIAGGGTVLDPTDKNVSIEYKVKSLEAGFTSDWITPWRLHFDYTTLSYKPAAVDDEGILIQFPDGAGSLTPMLIVPERVTGAVCEA